MVAEAIVTATLNLIDFNTLQPDDPDQLKQILDYILDAVDDPDELKAALEEHLKDFYEDQNLINQIITASTKALASALSSLHSTSTTTPSTTTTNTTATTTTPTTPTTTIDHNKSIRQSIIDMIKPTRQQAITKPNTNFAPIVDEPLPLRPNKKITIIKQGSNNNSSHDLQPVTPTPLPTTEPITNGRDRNRDYNNNNNNNNQHSQQQNERHHQHGNERHNTRQNKHHQQHDIQQQQQQSQQPQIQSSIQQLHNAGIDVQQALFALLAQQNQHQQSSQFHQQQQQPPPPPPPPFQNAIKQHETCILQPDFHGITYNLFLRRIPPTVLLTDLINFFIPYGNLVAIRFVSKPGALLQSALVHFSKEEPCLKILNTKPIIIDPTIIVDWAMTPNGTFSLNKNNTQNNDEHEHDDNNNNNQNGEHTKNNQKQSRQPRLMDPELLKSKKLSFDNVSSILEKMKTLKLKLVKELIALKTEAKNLGDGVTDELRTKIKNCEKSKKACEDQIVKLDAEKIELKKTIDEQDNLIQKQQQQQQDGGDENHDENIQVEETGQ